MATLLKYQHKVEQYIPEWMHYNQTETNAQKLYMGRQSLYYFCQFSYFASLYAWSMMFFKKARVTKPYYYTLGAALSLILAYLTDYHNHPHLKHLFWYSFAVLFGMQIGASCFQLNQMAAFDVLYMFGNSMSFFGVLAYFTEFPNKGLLASGLLASSCAMIYCVGFLRIIRCG